MLLNLKTVNPLQTQTFSHEYCVPTWERWLNKGMWNKEIANIKKWVLFSSGPQKHGIPTRIERFQLAFNSSGIAHLQDIVQLNLFHYVALQSRSRR